MKLHGDEGRTEKMIVYATIQSPVDDLLLVGKESPDDLQLTSLSMTGQRNAPAPQGDWRWAPEALAVRPGSSRPISRAT
jgi:hypothetical protein